MVFAVSDKEGLPENPCKRLIAIIAGRIIKIKFFIRYLLICIILGNGLRFIYLKPI
jgi:hypothetical protein